MRLFDLVSLLACLQEYLSRCCEGQTLLLVSHDRSFLNAVCQETVELKEQQLRWAWRDQRQPFLLHCGCGAQPLPCSCVLWHHPRC
jgi:hypothetical protein